MHAGSPLSAPPAAHPAPPLENTPASRPPSTGPLQRTHSPPLPPSHSAPPHFSPAYSPSSMSGAFPSPASAPSRSQPPPTSAAPPPHMPQRQQLPLGGAAGGLRHGAGAGGDSAPSALAWPPIPSLAPPQAFDRRHRWDFPDCSPAAPKSLPARLCSPVPRAHLAALASADAVAGAGWGQGAVSSGGAAAVLRERWCPPPPLPREVPPRTSPVSCELWLCHVPPTPPSAPRC